MNKIICGDSLEELAKIESDSIDLIITSPPYFKQRKYTKDKREIGSGGESGLYLQILLDVFNECVRVIKPTGSIVWNMGDTYIDKSLLLLPYRFALNILDHHKNIKLINDITWVKTNPTPRQYKKRLVSATEPFFHFVKSGDYYYDIDSYLTREKTFNKKVTGKKGGRYKELIERSDLSEDEKVNAFTTILGLLHELAQGEITDFRMKIRGVHKKAFGGQAGGRNNQIDDQGFTAIRMYGNKLKRDVIESPVANTKNIDHPAVFPLTLVEEVIKLLSEKGNVILDPFCGSGQVCIAAKSLDRQYLGIDLSPYYCEMTRKRL